MCLLAIAFEVLKDCPLLVFANREELRARPASPPVFHQGDSDTPAWLGGTDLTAGGTWLGVNQHGLIAAITNRLKSEIAPDVRSRGMLCRDMLACRNPDEALREAKDQVRRHPFAGFNLLLANRDGGLFIEASDNVRIKSLRPGLQIITNSTLNDPADGRIRRTRGELERVFRDTSTTLPDSIAQGKRICGLLADGVEPPVCFTGGDRGTVSSSIIALSRDATQSQYHHAPGPPSETDYQDYSDVLRQMLSTSDCGN